LNARAPVPRGWVRLAPNAVSAARIAAAPVLVYFAWHGNEAAFTWVLVPALLSDIVDGLLARALRLESQLGALLDSIGDALLLFVSIYGIWVFHAEVITDHRAWCYTMVFAWLTEAAVACVRYGRLSSFHTYVSKVAGHLLGIFVGVLFLFGFHPWLLYAAVATSVVGNLEELVLLHLLPEWRTDVRGVYWVLRERRRVNAST
jgi:CDP-diacylglycerol--glycerol-3-phosphate 3-phosphatidyltransferase